MKLNGRINYKLWGYVAQTIPDARLKDVKIVVKEEAFSQCSGFEEMQAESNTFLTNGIRNERRLNFLMFNFYVNF